MSEITRSPNVFHPTRLSAIGSRNSLAQEGRRQKDEFEELVQEETQNIINLVQTKLPREVLEKLEVMGGLKEKLYNYFNQNYQNMFNRYIVTTEDEMAKKIRNFIDKEEGKTLARYSPREVAELLEKISGAERFNTGGVEKSIVNMFGNLQTHIEKSVVELENETESLLEQRTDVGAFVGGDNTYSVVKCAFKDNPLKPKTVTDVKLSINVLDSELISPIFHYQSTMEFLVKDLISRAITDSIEREIEIFSRQLAEGGREPDEKEIIFEKMKRVSNYTDDKPEDEQSKRYTLMAKSLMDRIDGLRAEISPADFDPLNIRENLKKVLDTENVRSRGFNTAINSLTAILDGCRMGYQYIENLKNARELIVREYEDTEAVRLPDERYQIRLKYFDFEQLVKERNAYDKQMEAFKNEIFHLRDVVEAIYQGRKSMFKVTDFEDLARKVSGRIRKVKKDTDPLYEEIEQVWNKITSIKAEMTELEKLNQTYLYEKTLYKKLLANLRSKIQRVYGHQNPGPRVILDGQLDFLYAEFDSFEYLINPYHILPGLLLDVDITSIKRKRYTLATMGNVLNEFLSGVSRGFQDAAFAAFKHRRALREERPPVREPVFPVESATPSVQAEVNAREDELKVKANVTPSPQRRRQGPSGNFAEL